MCGSWVNLVCALALATTAVSCRQAEKPASVSGTLETDQVRLASRYGGRVERLLAQEGDRLTNGQVIVELSAPELVARLAQVTALLAELEAGPRAEELAVARAEWEAQAAELELARADRQRAERLFSAEAVPETERDRAVTREKALEKSVAAARSRYDLLRAGTRSERLAQVRAQRAELEAQARELRVVAPGPCLLETLNVKPGDTVAPNREVATVLRTDHTFARVYVPAPWLGRIKLGDRVPVRVDAFPGREFAGEVEFIGRWPEFTPRNVQTVEERLQQVFPVKVRLPDADGELRAGMTVEVVFAGAGK